MIHAVSLFAGPVDVLARFREVVPSAPIVWLTPGAAIAALPLTDAVHDALHRANGTGDWAETGPRLSSTDRAFARQLSVFGPIAYLETDQVGRVATQRAVLWIGGEISLGPAAMSAAQGAGRARHLWPINAALRGLGVRAGPDGDEFHVFGLESVRSNADILARGRLVAAR